MTELTSRFAISAERGNLLTGLLDYRAALRALGVVSGVQWIDGSFVEDVETIRGGPPRDIDLVTLAPRPEPDPALWRQMIAANGAVFDPRQSKARFRCDAYFIDLAKRGDLVAADSVYFSGLFSHQRVTGTWKGMIAIPMTSDDDAARLMI